MGKNKQEKNKTDFKDLVTQPSCQIFQVEDEFVGRAVCQLESKRLEAT